MHEQEKSDSAIVAVKPPNKTGIPAAEAVEPRAGTKGNAGQQSTLRTQDPGSRVPGAGPRTASRKAKEEGAVHRASPPCQRRDAPEAFYALKRKAAPGVDGVTWQDYEADLEPRLEDLHDRVHRGATGRSRLAGRTYRRRTGGNGRWRLPPWRTRSSRAHVVMVLNAIYEEDFLGFSYGFRPGRDRMMRWMPWRSAITSRKVNYILDADIRSSSTVSARNG